MPAKLLGPRLYLRKRGSKNNYWVIRDKNREIATSVTEDDLETAKEHLKAYRSRKANYRRRRRGCLGYGPAAIGFVYFVEIAAEDRPVKIGFATLADWGY